MVINLRRWIYLDHDGIISLHGQFSPRRAVEQSFTSGDTRSRSIHGIVKGGAPWLQGEIGSERKRDERQEVTEKTVYADVQLFVELEEFLAANEGLSLIRGARDIAEIYATGQTAFATGVLRFRWARSHSADVIEDAITKQMIEFSLDRDATEDAGTLAVPVTMAGSLGKCVDRGSGFDGRLTPTSHLAMFLRHLGDGAVPLGFFAQLTPLPKLIYLKPYAIWFP